MKKGCSMSEQDLLQRSATEDAVEFRQESGDYVPSPGALLRQGREAAGMHLASLAASLKVSVGKIEALEQDQFHLLPDAVFVRALAASVCRILKLDPVPILDRLPAIHTGKPAPQNRGINESFRTRNVGLARSTWSSISRPAVLGGIVLLLGALILVFLPSLRQQDVFSTSASNDAQADNGTTMVLPALLSGVPGGSDAASEGVTPAASAAVSGDSAQTLSAVVTKPAVPIASSPASPAALTGKAVSAGSTDSSTGLTFRATGPSWIKVIDAKGQVVLNRTLQAGEVTDVTGVFPLAVTVGRTDVTQVQVRGQAFDLAAVSKNNIARFEVK